MKKLIIISQLLLINWAIISLFPVLKLEWQLEKSWIDFNSKKPSEHQKEQLVTFIIQELEDLHWKKPNKEFELDGIMYDVIAITPNYKGFTLICEIDKREIKAINDFKKESSKQQKQKDKSANKTLFYLSHSSHYFRGLQVVRFRNNLALPIIQGHDHIKDKPPQIFY